MGTWYLPAICELGGAGQGAGCLSGLANIDTNLVQLGFSGLNGAYWSSTEYSLYPTLYTWAEIFVTASYSLQDAVLKNTQFGTRCVRAMTY
jgi:hypothetical protein